jgi:hypothetical protein
MVVNGERQGLVQPMWNFPAFSCVRTTSQLPVR